MTHEGCVSEKWGDRSASPYFSLKCLEVVLGGGTWTWRHSGTPWSHAGPSERSGGGMSHNQMVVLDALEGLTEKCCVSSFFFFKS